MLSGLFGEMALFQDASSGKRFVCCTLTVLYILYTMVSAQQRTFCLKNASRNNTILPKKYIGYM